MSQFRHEIFSEKLKRAALSLEAGASVGLESGAGVGGLPSLIAYTASITFETT